MTEALGKKPPFSAETATTQEHHYRKALLEAAERLRDLAAYSGAWEQKRILELEKELRVSAGEEK